MSTGKVKYFNDLKGWGFISSEDSAENIYVHYTEIKMDGYKTLKPGQTVLFEVTDTDKGQQAQNVTLAS
ncbi:MAG: cold shock domain-containing protein [candidate division Zixibacteria bacterium]|nr:cold shock domain-containing protein [candidate division Zixibacteria bacterium]MDH3937728.1 cold shock domain-containing protein [candidate division Zixibacteria bacterium]MDH4033741.1 cold shock domain-containing protein [candidate division Zixibacteria bacterium]